MDNLSLVGVVLFVGALILTLDGLLVVFSRSYFEWRQNKLRGGAPKTNGEVKYHHVNRYTIGLGGFIGGILALCAAIIILLSSN